MKFISTRPILRMQTPNRITHFGPNLSVSHPASGASIPPSSLPILAATDVTAEAQFRSYRDEQSRKSVKLEAPTPDT